VQTAEATDEVWGAIRDIEAHVQHLDASVKADQLQCEKERKCLAERQELSSALKQRLHTLPAPVERRAEGNQETLEHNIQGLQNVNSILMRQLSEFLDAYYPEESPSQSRSALSQSQATQDLTRGLKELLQDLMNRSVTKAGNPWLHLTPQNSRTEHVELLLRAGIALKDPEDGRRMKLVDFYR